MLRMQNPFPFRINRLFFRILTYFLSFLILIIVIGIFFYVRSVQTQNLESSERISLTASSSANTIDTYLFSAHEASLGFFSDPAVQQLKPYSLYTLREKSELAAVPRALSRYTNLINNNVDSVFVYLDQEKIYTSSGIEEFPLFFNKFNLYKEYPLSYWQQKLQTDKLFEILPPTALNADVPFGRNVIPFVSLGQVNGNNVLMVVNFAVDNILHTLRSNSIFPTAQFVVLDAENHVLLNSGEYSKDDIAKIVRSVPNPKLSGSLSIAGINCLVTSVRSGTYGWNYYTIVSERELSKQTQGIFKFIVFVCCALLLIGITFAFIFSSRLYAPIRKISDILIRQEETWEPGDRVAVRRGNELELIGAGVDQLLKRNHLFKDRLNQLSEEYFENALHQLISGRNMQSEKEFTEVLRSHFGFICQVYGCCNIKIDFKEAFYGDIPDVDRFLVLSKLKNVVAGLMKECVDCCVIEYKPALFVCIVSIENAEESRLKKALFNVIKTFEYDSQYCSVNIGIGKMYPRLRDIAKSYNDAMTAIDKGGTGQLNIMDSSEIAIQNKYYYSFLDQSKIINLLKIGEYEELVDFIKELIVQNREKGVSHHFISALLREIHNTAYRFAAEKGLDFPAAAEDDQAFDAAEKQEALFRYLFGIIDNLKDPSEEKNGSIVSMILQYISANYDKDLYLEKIADEIGSSSKYISRIFKEKTGENLSDHINLTRITKAKELLLQTNLNVNVISEKVGIFSRTTFIRLFKKYEGITPVEFRKLKNNIK